MSKKTDTPLAELGFLWNSIIGILFLVFLAVTIVLVWSGFTGIKPIIQFVIPLSVGAMILAVTIILRREVSGTVKSLVYLIYPLLFIVCSSGSFNSVFTFFAEKSFFRIENSKWQSNLQALKTESSIILGNYANVDSIIYLARDIERRLYFEIDDGGFGDGAEEIFGELDAALGGNKLRMPSRSMSDSLVLIDMKRQVNEVIGSIESRSGDRIKEANDLSTVIELDADAIIDRLSDNTALSNSDPSTLLQEASSLFFITDADLFSRTGKGVTKTDKDLEVKSLSNIFDTFKLLSSSDARLKYLMAIFIALVFSLFVEGGVLILSYILGKEKEQENTLRLVNLEEEVKGFKEEINSLKASIERKNSSFSKTIKAYLDKAIELENELKVKDEKLEKINKKLSVLTEIRAKIIKNEPE